MTRGWEPGTQYDLGDEVEYEGHKYKIIQAHRSQGDWTPDRTPALWGLIPYHECDEHHREKHREKAQDRDRQQRPPNEWNQPDQGRDKPVQIPYQTEQIQPDERQKKWYDLDDKRKKELEVGGGLAAGLALLGAGYAAYHHHQKSQEDQKAVAWGAQNWLDEAQKRSQRYNQSGPSGPTTWVLVHGKQFPDGALQGGQSEGETFYIARAFIDGGVHVGKASQNSRQGACIGYDRKVTDFETYELLLGDENAVRWVDCRGQLNVDRLGIRPVEAGREASGEAQYIIQAEYRGGVHCGKVAESYKDGGYIAFDGKEVEVDNYRVLAYN